MTFTTESQKGRKDGSASFYCQDDNHLSKMYVIDDPVGETAADMICFWQL